MMGPDLQLPEDENTPEKRTAKIFNQLDKNMDDQVRIDENHYTFFLYVRTTSLVFAQKLRTN